MKILKDILIFVGYFNAKVFLYIASFASIFGVATFFVEKSWAVIFSLAFFCLMLLAFTVSLIYTLFRVLDVRSKDYESKSTFIKFEALTKVNLIYETYKLIQSKKPLLSEIDYKFKWSGTLLPKITSNLQDVINVVDLHDSEKYDNAILKLRTPLYFNQDQILHFRAELDDTDLKANPWISNRIIQSVEIIHYRIILKYKAANYNANAFVERIKSNSISRQYELIQEIPFDKLTKSYEYHLLYPIIGYTYRIRWTK